MKRLLAAALGVVLLSSLCPLYADDAATYDDIAFPQWAKDVRRTEIITFGSLPFVTIWATIAYSEYEYGEFHNPLDKSADGFSPEDQKAIMQIAAVTCLGLGLADLTITLVRRALAKRRNERRRPLDAITITPFRADERTPDDAIDRRNERDNESRRLPPPAEHLQGGIESAVF